MGSHYRICLWGRLVLVTVVLCLGIRVQAENYAILFAGGGSTDENKSWFYDETIRQYDNLVNHLGFLPGNIYICAADGLDPGVDQYRYVGANVSSDWSHVTGTGGHVLAGTGAELCNQMHDINSTAADLVHIWVYDHGWTDTSNIHYPSDLGVSGWHAGGGGDFDRDNLNQWAGDMPAWRQSFVFGECFSGGMLEGLYIAPGEQWRHGAASACFDEESFYDPFYTSYVEAYNDAIQGGRTFTGAIASYAQSNDGYRPGGTCPWHTEHPYSEGANFNLKPAVYTGTSHSWDDTWTIAPDIDNTCRVMDTYVIINSPGKVAGFLTIQGQSSNSYVQIDSGGGLHSRFQTIGDGDLGHITQTGGSNVVDNDIIIGDHEWGILAIGSGHYDISGGTCTVGGNVCLGVGAGVGWLNSTGGVFSVVGDLRVGDSTAPYDHSEVNLSNLGLIQTHNTIVGSAWAATFVQSGGTHRPYYLTVGQVAVRHDLASTYTLSGGTLEALSGEVIGDISVGALNQTDGYNHDHGFLTLGKSASGVGTYNISYSTLDCLTAYIGYEGTGVFNQNGSATGSTWVTVSLGLSLACNSAAAVGTYNLQDTITHISHLQADSEVIGDMGTGTFNHTGGIHQVTNSIVLGQQSGSTGTYNLSGVSTFTCGTLVVGDGGDGTFTQTGGTSSSNDLYVARGMGLIQSTYTLNADDPGGFMSAALWSAGTEYIGEMGRAVFNHSKGTNMCSGSVYIGHQGGSNGQYTLGGSGVLNCRDVFVADAGTGTLSVSGTAEVYARDVRVGNQSGAIGEVDAGGRIFKVNSISVGVSGQGSFLHYAGETSVSDAVTLGQELYSYGTYALSGPTTVLSANSLTVGAKGSAEFHQTDGQALISGDVVLGGQAGSHGVYFLDAGTLQANNLTCGNFGAGAFADSCGGVVNLSGALAVAQSAGGNGSFNIDGGSLRVGDVSIGCGGPGLFQIANSSSDIHVLGDVTLGPLAVIQAVPGSSVHFGGSSVYLQSTKPSNLSGLRNITFVFEGGKKQSDTLEVGGTDKGVNLAGLFDNFALDTLQIGGKDVGRVTLQDSYDNQTGNSNKEAIYVVNLQVGAGSTLSLSGLNLYCVFADIANGATVTGGTVQLLPHGLGDTNLDGLIGAADLDTVYAHFGSDSLQFDVSGDGVASQADVDYLLKNILHKAYGDVNLDGKVDFGDFQVLLDHWLHSDAGWTAGDFTGNGTVDFADFQRLLDNWNPVGISESPVPEPTTLSLLSLGALSLLRRRKQPSEQE